MGRFLRVLADTVQQLTPQISSILPTRNTLEATLAIDAAPSIYAQCFAAAAVRSACLVG